MRRPGRDRNELVERAKRYLSSAAYGRVEVSAVARAVGVSPSYLTRVFRAAENVSLYRYELNLRLARAASLLGSSDDLGRLALDLGFSSHSHFSTAFLRWTGATPSDYRALLRLHADAAGGPSEAVVSARQ